MDYKNYLKNEPILSGKIQQKALPHFPVSFRSNAQGAQDADIAAVTILIAQASFVLPGLLLRHPAMLANRDYGKISSNSTKSIYRHSRLLK